MTGISRCGLGADGRQATRSGASAGQTLIGHSSAGVTPQRLIDRGNASRLVEPAEAWETA